MIILCADDFALSRGVSAGIAQLARSRRLSATSAIVTLPRWQCDAALLKALSSTVAVGLHLNLTLGRPLIDAGGTRRGRPGHIDRTGRLASLGKLLHRAFAGRLDVEALTRECAAQIDLFARHSGDLPDFIDGHQHVHTLPQVRTALLRAIKQFSWRTPPLVRVPAGIIRLRGTAGRQLERRRTYRTGAKRRFIAWMGLGLRRELIAARLPHNDTFSGFSAFRVGSNYASELRNAIDEYRAGAVHLIMCHPGHVDDELIAAGDEVTERRGEELHCIETFERLPERIWQPERRADGRIDWEEIINAARSLNVTSDDDAGQAS